MSAKQRRGTKVDHARVGAGRRKPPENVIAIGARVEVTIAVADKTGAVSRPAFGEVVALDQVAVRVEGELEPRAFEPRKVKPL